MRPETCEGIDKEQSNWNTLMTFNVWNDDLTKLVRIKCNITKHKELMLKIGSTYVGEKCKTWELTGSKPDITIH